MMTTLAPLITGERVPMRETSVFARTTNTAHFGAVLKSAIEERTR
jgi:hypothetical protein